METTTKGPMVYSTYQCSFCNEWTTHGTYFINNFEKPFIYSLRCNHCQQPQVWRAQFTTGRIELLERLALKDVYVERKQETGITVKYKQKKPVRTSKG